MALLLSLGALPIACNNDEKDDTTVGSTPGTNPSTAGMSTSGTSDGTTTGTTGASATDSPTSTPTASDPTPGTSMTNTSPGTSPTTSASGTTGTEMTTFLTSDTEPDTGFETDTDLPPPTDPNCIAYAAHIVECSPRYARYQEYIAQQCEFYKNYAGRSDGQACVDAFDAYYVCYSMVDCAAITMGNDMDICPTEAMAIDSACPTFAGGDTDTDTDTDSGGSSG